MNHYVMLETPTDSDDAVDPRVVARTYGRIEAEMLVALLRHRSPLEKNATLDWSISIVSESQLDHDHVARRSVASFEIDGPDPKDALEIEILRALLARFEDEGDLRRCMVQRLLVEDARFDHLWKEPLLEWIMRGGPHMPGDTENVLGIGGDMTVFERLLAEKKAELDQLMKQVSTRESVDVEE